MENGRKNFWSADPKKVGIGSKIQQIPAEGLSVKERAVHSSFSKLKDAPLFGPREGNPYNDALETLKQAKLVRTLRINS